MAWIMALVIMMIGPFSSQTTPANIICRYKNHGALNGTGGIHSGTQGMTLTINVRYVRHTRCSHL